MEKFQSSVLGIVSFLRLIRPPALSPALRSQDLIADSMSSIVAFLPLTFRRTDAKKLPKN